jgi:hypothetical protein
MMAITPAYFGTGFSSAFEEDFESDLDNLDEASLGGAFWLVILSLVLVLVATLVLFIRARRSSSIMQGSTELQVGP